MIKMVKYRILQILLNCITQRITWADIMSLKLETITTSVIGLNLTILKPSRAIRVNDPRTVTIRVHVSGGSTNA